jgi:hypothetical protein
MPHRGGLATEDESGVAPNRVDDQGVLSYLERLAAEGDRNRGDEVGVLTDGLVDHCSSLGLHGLRSLARNRPALDTDQAPLRIARQLLPALDQ